MTNFTAKDVVAIIKALEGSNVTKITIDGLGIECGPAADEAKTPEPVQWATNDIPESNVRNIREQIETDPDIQELKRQSLMIEDPHAFETMMDREDIDDATNS